MAQCTSITGQHNPNSQRLRDCPVHGATASSSPENSSKLSAAPPARAYMRDIEYPDLDHEVEFDSPFTIDAEGDVDDARPDGVHAPETVYLDDEGEIEYLDDDWEPISGYSGQYGYKGPVMHPSEVLGGGSALEREVRSNPGVYVLVAVEANIDDEGAGEEPAGWMILRRKPEAAKA